MPVSPTVRTLKELRSCGYEAEVVEKFLPFGGKRRDLFGCIDIVAVKSGEPPIGIQATSKANISARFKKSTAQPKLKVWLEAGCKFEVWGWGSKQVTEKRKRWFVTKRPVTLEDMKSDDKTTA